MNTYIFMKCCEDSNGLRLEQEVINKMYNNLIYMQYGKY